MKSLQNSDSSIILVVYEFALSCYSRNQNFHKKNHIVVTTMYQLLLESKISKYVFRIYAGIPAYDLSLVKLPLVGSDFTADKNFVSA
mgnify:CR=1 FL=1